MRWTAPEALEDHKYSTHSDCWSFGILLHEMWTKAERPYQDMSNQKVWVAVIGGYRLPCPPSCPVVVHDVMMQCWATNPSERPSFESLHNRLRQLESGSLPNRSPSTLNRSQAFPILDHEHDYRDFTSGSGQLPPMASRLSLLNTRVSAISSDLSRMDSLSAVSDSQQSSRSSSVAINPMSPYVAQSSSYLQVGDVKLEDHFEPMSVESKEISYLEVGKSEGAHIETAKPGDAYIDVR